jgi:hypothetical protein
VIRCREVVAVELAELGRLDDEFRECVGLLCAYDYLVALLCDIKLYPFLDVVFLDP